MNPFQYTDPLGSLRAQWPTLYDFIPALRGQRSRGILEPQSEQPTQSAEAYQEPSNSGFGGGTEGWGGIGTPGPQELGLARDPNFGPLDAAQFAAGMLMGNPLSLGLSTAMELTGAKPMNLLDPSRQMMPAAVRSVSVPVGTFDSLGLNTGLLDGPLSGNSEFGGTGFGGAGLGAIGGFEGDSIGNIGGVEGYV